MSKLDDRQRFWTTFWFSSADLYFIELFLLVSSVRDVSSDLSPSCDLWPRAVILSEGLWALGLMPGHEQRLQSIFQHISESGAEAAARRIIKLLRFASSASLTQRLVQTDDTWTLVRNMRRRGVLICWKRLRQFLYFFFLHVYCFQNIHVTFRFKHGTPLLPADIRVFTF